MLKEGLELLPSGIKIHFQNNLLQDFFDEIIDYESDIVREVPRGYYFLKVRGQQDKIVDYLCKPKVDLLEYLFDCIDPKYLEFGINFSDKKKGFLLARQTNKYKTLWLAELNKL